jgi:ABC-type antimicrobial peptide transport system ATPase subunit
MLIHGALGDAGARRNLVHRDPQEALPPEQAVGRIQDAPMRLVA